jgi:uncharacterized pyridoxal phosphate-containing UPF0001 family protein
MFDLKVINAVLSQLEEERGIPKEKIIEAINCGCSVFGENYVQEASDKWTDLKLKFPDISLHLIGNLQSNKVKQALNIFDYIQTLDREKLAIALSKELIKCKAQTKFFIQVNIGEESQKSGIEISQVDDFVKYCINDLKLKIEGLMAIPPASDFASPYFALLKKIANRNHLKKLNFIKDSGGGEVPKQFDFILYRRNLSLSKKFVGRSPVGIGLCSF